MRLLVSFIAMCIVILMASKGAKTGIQLITMLAAGFAYMKCVFDENKNMDAKAMFGTPIAAAIFLKVLGVI